MKKEKLVAEIGLGQAVSKKHSKAPVYVVVKSYAASMAALITTLATKSYAYPNATILHHQPSSDPCFDRSNVRDKQEAYEALRKVWEFLGR